MNKKELRRQAGGTPTRSETLEVDALLADLDRARKGFEAAERRARTYLVHRGVTDQTCRDLTSLLRECLAHRLGRDDHDRARRLTGRGLRLVLLRVGVEVPGAAAEERQRGERGERDTGSGHVCSQSTLTGRIRK